MRFQSKPIEEHAEVPLADGGRWEALIARWKQQQDATDDARALPRSEDGTRVRSACYVLSVHRPGDHNGEHGAGAQLAEITGLVDAQGDRVVGSESYRLTKPDSRTLIRSGVAERIADAARACGADMLVIDAELSPSQARNLEDATGLPVCDREAVILNVFERHANTRRARIQVEIAHLQYLRPRIRGIGLNMDQQTGGSVLSRGAGETASELLARQLDTRLADLRRRLTKLQRSAAAQRKHRDACDRVVLIGYTNAGKTSLMNALTSADLSARDRPFETLDTTSRCLTRHGGDVLISDTVGFIRRLPERLFESFASTLAEVTEASLLLIVVDASDPERKQHLATTDAVLQKLGASDVPRLIVFNKIDRLDASPDMDALREVAGDTPMVALSSHDATAVETLEHTIVGTVRRDQETREIFVPYAQHSVTDALYRQCRVIKAIASERGTQFLIEGRTHIVNDIARAVRRSRE